LPKTKILSTLRAALVEAHVDVDGLVERLASIYRDENLPKSSEQVIALGFLACARALREASLMQELAIREEIQDLERLITEVLTEIRRTEEVVREQLELLSRVQRRRERALPDDLSPSRASNPEA